MTEAEYFERIAVIGFCVAVLFIVGAIMFTGSASGDWGSASIFEAGLKK